MMQNIIAINSQNFDSRPKDSVIDHVILHYTEIPFEETVTKFCNPTYIVSAHYVIKQNGQVFQFVADELRARHAGISSFRGRTNFNDFSIGIELVNSGKEIYPEIQMQSCIDLCLSLKHKYNIPAENFIGHSDIAPSRKIDPGIFFDWVLLRKYDLGIHLFSPFSTSSDQIINLDEIIVTDKDANIINIQNQLYKFGYDVKATGRFDQQTSDAIRAFQLHFSKESIKSQNHFIWDRRSDLILSQMIISPSQN